MTLVLLPLVLYLATYCVLFSTLFVGMGCDPEVARHGGRWRAAAGPEADAWAAALTGARVKGTLPNLTANGRWPFPLSPDGDDLPVPLTVAFSTSWQRLQR